MNATDAANLYNCIKLHFNDEKYDAIHYNFKLKPRPLKEGYYFIFDKLSKKYKDNLIDYYISLFLNDPKVWINDLLSEDNHEIYLRWKKKKESLSYIFSNDISNLLDKYSSINDLIIIENQYPQFMNEVLKENVQIETLLMTNSILKFFGYWSKKLSGDVIWEPFKLKCRKYYRFMHFDKDRVKDILIKEVNFR